MQSLEDNKDFWERTTSVIMDACSHLFPRKNSGRFFYSGSFFSMPFETYWSEFIMLGCWKNFWTRFDLLWMANKNLGANQETSHNRPLKYFWTNWCYTAHGPDKSLGDWLCSGECCLAYGKRELRCPFEKRFAMYGHRVSSIPLIWSRPMCCVFVRMQSGRRSG